MKVVYCIPGIYAAGGTERVVINKANYLSSKGYDVIIITTDQNNRGVFFKLDKRVKHFDLKINYYKNSTRSLLIKLYYFFCNRILHRIRLRELLLYLKADVVISIFMNEMSILPYINDGSKKILEFHFSRPFFKINRKPGLIGVIHSIQERLDISIIKKYDKFVVLTEEDKLNWQELSNLSVIPNASSIEGEVAVHDGDVIAVGRLTAQKGFNRLIDVWSRVGVERTLKIYGAGELHEDLEKQIKALHLDKKVFLEEPTSNMQKVYSESSLLVMTSFYEGLPMVMLEAQSFGLPIVSFDFPCGPKDVIDDGKDGYIIRDGDVSAMAEKITELLQNDDMRVSMGINAKNKSVRYKQDKIMQQWCDLFDEITNA